MAHGWNRTTTVAIRFWLIMLLVLLPTTTLAQQEGGLFPLPLAAEWAWGSPIAGACGSPTVNGFACIRFPAGARIWGIAWQSSVKIGPHEVLFHLVMSPQPSQLNGTALLSTHQVSDVPNSVARTVILPSPIIVPAGWYVWIYAIGTGPPHAAPVESATMIYVEASAAEAL